MAYPLTREQVQARHDAALNAAKAEQARKALEETVACSRCAKPLVRQRGTTTDLCWLCRLRKMP